MYKKYLSVPIRLGYIQGTQDDTSKITVGQIIGLKSMETLIGLRKLLRLAASVVKQSTNFNSISYTVFLQFP